MKRDGSNFKDSDSINKVEDLTANAYGTCPELNNSKSKNLLEYYQNLMPRGYKIDKKIYLYASPKEQDITTLKFSTKHVYFAVMKECSLL